MPQVVAKIMAHSSDSVKLKATDILLSVVSHDPAPLRMFLLGQKGDETLFARLVGEFVGPADNGLPEQIAELLKLLLDPETMDGNVGALACLKCPEQQVADDDDDDDWAPAQPSDRMHLRRLRMKLRTSCLATRPRSPPPEEADSCARSATSESAAGFPQSAAPPPSSPAD
jgi:hypothetical protein